MTIAKPEKPLPKGWRYAKLGEVCVQDKQTIAPNDPIAKTLKYIGLENVESNSGRIIISNDADTISDIRGNAFQFDSRHVLYGKLRPYLNKVALPYSAGRCTTELVPLLPTQIVREYLALYLRTPKAVDWAMQGKTGSRMPRTDMTEFMKLSIPLPPLAEQRRIVAALEAQMAAVERARNAAAEILSAVEALNGALMRKFLPLERQKLPRDWKWVTLGEVCELVIGKTPGRNNLKAWGGKHQWAKISDLDGIVCETEETLSDVGAKICQGRLLKKGTLLYSFKLTIGKTAFAGVDLYTNEAIVGLIPKSDQVVTPPFLNRALSVIDPMEHAGHAVKGKTLNKKTLELIKIPLPPLAEQRRIVAALEAQMAAADGAKRAAVVALNELRNLPGALLRQAFAGELG